MARNKTRPLAWEEHPLQPTRRNCIGCGYRMWVRYTCTRKIISLKGLVQYHITVRACNNKLCDFYHKPYRPEEEGGLALPKGEYGLDVIAWIGNSRYREHRTGAEIHKILQEKEVTISLRSVTNLIAYYEELVALRLKSNTRLLSLLKTQGKMLLAFDGMQPDVGHEVLWVFRDLISGEILLAKCLLSSTTEDIATMIREIKETLPVPIVGVVTDGQPSLRKAVAQALPDVPHQLCQYHYLKEAIKPTFEADRHAKKELKKQVRGVRALERECEKENTEESHFTSQYCQAVRSALTNDGHPPLTPAGITLRSNLQSVVTSIERVTEKGGCSLS